MHLFVNGTSVASGVGTGGEKFKGFGDGDITTSWAHFLANMLNCDRLWNHSLPSKPMSFTIADTMGFCEQYWQKYGTYENLFAIIEWSMPHAHGKWNQVTSNISSYNNQIILPIVVSWPDNPAVYETLYVSKCKKPDYLANKAIYNRVDWRSIKQESRVIHEQQRNHYYNKVYNFSLRLSEAAREIHHIKQWLRQRNIQHLMFWAYGAPRDTDTRRFVDRSIFSVLGKDPTFIPIKEFTACDASLHSLAPFRNHPDIHGQKYIADYLYNYIAQHQLLTPGTLIHT